MGLAAWIKMNEWMNEWIGHILPLCQNLNPEQLSSSEALFLPPWSQALTSSSSSSGICSVQTTVSVSWDLEITSTVLFNSYTGCPYGRVLYKQCILMYKINCGQAPKYITDLVSTVAAMATRSGLRSGDTTNYSLPRLRTKLEGRAFSYAGPAAWYRLPQNICASTYLNFFQPKPKT